MIHLNCVQASVNVYRGYTVLIHLNCVQASVNVYRGYTVLIHLNCVQVSVGQRIQSVHNDTSKLTVNVYHRIHLQ